MVARQAMVARGLQLEYLTIGWNSMEALIAIITGLLAGSVALLSFGLDSIIEVSSGAALLWRLRADPELAGRERAERRARQVVGISFLTLALYVAFEATETLLRHELPRRSVLGIALAVASLIVMPLLARAKRRVACGLGSDAMRADSRQTDICAFLSAILLGGLLVNATLGWWWADPVAGLAMLPLITKEGIDALRGRACCEPVAYSFDEVDRTAVE